VRAVRMAAPRKMEIVEAPDPEVGQNQVLVRMKEIAVCGSDLITFLGTHPRKYPYELGSPAHECVGIVVESKLDGYRPGDRVLYFPPPTIENALRQLVAAGADQLLKLPDHGSITEWMMAQLLGTVIRTTRELGSVLGEKVVVIGQGPVGQLFNAMMWNLGARKIIALDKVADRLKVSPKMHATHTFQVGRDDVAKAVLDLTDGKGGDLVIEAAGYEDAHNLMIDLVRVDGRAVMFGVPKHEKSTVDMYRWYRKRAKLYTFHRPNVEDDIHLALELIVEGRIDVRPILTHRFPFDRVQEAYDLFADRKDGCIKVIVEFP